MKNLRQSLNAPDDSWIIRTPPGPGGGIGRRSGFKIRRRKACQFESGSGHHDKQPVRSPVINGFFVVAFTYKTHKKPYFLLILLARKRHKKTPRQPCKKTRSSGDACTTRTRLWCPQSESNQHLMITNQLHDLHAMGAGSGRDYSRKHCELCPTLALPSKSLAKL